MYSRRFFNTYEGIKESEVNKMLTIDAIKNLGVAMGRFNSVADITATDVAGAIQAIADTYVTEVTFSTTPSTGVTIVVKKGTEVQNPDSNGKYHLAKGSYTYTATAEGYTTQTDVALTIAQSDITTGSKSVTVTMAAVVSGDGE